MLDRGRLATTRSATLRAVLRGLPLGEGARFAIAGVELLVLSRAKAAQWPDIELRSGDLEAVAWVAPDQTDRVADALLADPRVIAVRFDAAPVEIG
ncbi:MAG: hypothetical protein HYV09_00545 [Deltaproteobacteria bacterium]|nr:hypothetical protein [Deltaproteobacteria bacterium]